MARSLLRQLEQIRRSSTYNDSVSSVNSSVVAEPTISGSLEEDLNVIRTLIKQLKGTTNWYDALGTYFNPTNTTSGGDYLEEFDLNSIRGNTLDAKSIIIGVSNDNLGYGWTVSGTSTGILMDLTTRYAGGGGGLDRTGLPIFSSVLNAGSYYDEGGSNNVCRIDVLNVDSELCLQDSFGRTIFAKFHDAVDFGGVGDGTDVFVKFYYDDMSYGVECDLSTVSGLSDTVKFIYPQRKRLSDVAEYEWQRTKFTSAWSGDIGLMEDVLNLWSYIGTSNDITNPGAWTNEGANYILQSSPDDLTTAIDFLNTQIGSRLYTDDNYITDGDTISSSLDALDQALKSVADSVGSGSAGRKYVESVALEITKNTTHYWPAEWGLTYTPSFIPGKEGANVDVYIDGQLLAADTGNGGINADRDYAEEEGPTTTASGFMFRFTIQAGRNITYIVRQ
jgi:hypothetical protein